MNIKAIVLGLGAAALIGFAAAAENRFSLSGTYEGVFACDDISDGVPSGFFSPATVAIVQRGSQHIDLELTYEDVSGTETSLYTGSVLRGPAGGTVSGFFEACGGSYASRELARIFPAAATDDDFSFSADSIFQSTEAPGFEGVLVVESCKYVLARVSKERPRIETCD